MALLSGLKDGMPAFVVCSDDECRFSEGFDDIRQAPQKCPGCGRQLLAACPKCGMLLRNRFGLCTNCGRKFFPRTTTADRPR